MGCAWQAYLNLLPPWIRSEVDKFGMETLEEIRLRVGLHPYIMRSNSISDIQGIVSEDDLQFVINIATNYSPWTTPTFRCGYITVEGGHRIGVCGDTVLDQHGKIATYSSITSLNLRLAKDFDGVATGLNHYNNSILIIGKPGTGKTTLLRDYIRQRSDAKSRIICVIDEKRELFPAIQGKSCYYPGNHTDIISGCNKLNGIHIMLRNMNPDTIAVDEITEEDDCIALLKAGWCGVHLLATAHAQSREDLQSRDLYKPLITSGIFQYLVILNEDKQWHIERI